MLPIIAANCKALDCHLASRSNTTSSSLRGMEVNSAAASINHAVTATHTVNVCSPSHPLMPATLKATRQVTANNKPASTSAENLFSVTVAIKIPATTVVMSVSHPGKLPVAIVPMLAAQGAKLNEITTGKSRRTFKIT